MSTVIFDSAIAKEVGVNAAIVYERIRYFAQWAHDHSQENHFHENRWWTYATRKGWQLQLPFLTEKQIRIAIDTLIKAQFIITGCFNKTKYDRTLWYSPLALQGKCICPVGQFDMALQGQSIGPTRPIEITPKGQPIPNESTNESTNESIIYNAQSPKRRPSEFDFDSLYSKYPRKEGKTRGLKICATQIKSQDDYQNLSKSIDNYSVYCASKVKDPKFIKHFSSFMAEWRDWIEYKSNNIQDMTPEQFEKWLGGGDAQ